MNWPINDIARLTGVTSRTLRHYDEIGLLPPAQTDNSGRRYYGESELLRLQEILLLRSLGLRLNTIAEALAQRSDSERIEILEKHRAQLKNKRERIDQVIQAVNRTIQRLKEKQALEPNNMFAGLIENSYEPEARELYGDQAVDDANEKVRSLSKENSKLLTSGMAFNQVHTRLAELKQLDRPTHDPHVQDVIKRHFEIVSLVWTPNAESYIALGQSYLDHESFRKNIGQGDDSLVSYLADAMKVFATNPERAID